jgi:hypothetical protein
VLSMLSDDELMCLVHVLNERCDVGDYFIECVSRTPGNPVRHFQADARVIVAELLNEAMARGILRPPPFSSKLEFGR